jgi:phage-related holin
MFQAPPHSTSVTTGDSFSLDSIVTFALSLLAVFAPLQKMMVALLFLVSADFLTGIWAAYHTKSPISSRRLARTIVKTFVYLTTVCVVHVANKFLLSAGDFSLPLDSLIISFIALTELKSIFENLHKVQKQPFLQFLIDRIASDSSQVADRLDAATSVVRTIDTEESKPTENKKAGKKKEKKRGPSNRQK